MASRPDNETIRGVLRSDSKERLPFVCECGQPDCLERVWLSVEELTWRIAHDEPIRAHEATALQDA